jgi:hypothetical protein
MRRPEFSASGKIHGRRADEAGDELVGGLIVQLERLPHLLHHAVLHDDDPVAQRHGLDLIVGDVNGGGAETQMQFLQLDAHLHPQLGIEVRQRLVEQEHAGVAHDGAAQRHALTLPAGKLARLALQQFADGEDVGRVPHALVDLGLFEFAHLEAERHVVVDAHMRVERVILEYHGDVAVHRRQCIDHVAVDGDIAGADRLKPGNHPERRGLAAAGRSDEHHELLVADLQIDVFDSVYAVVELIDPLEDDLSHWLQPFTDPVNPAT